MLGAPVDAVEPLHAGLADIVIGLVEEVRPHPNADRLRVCRVNDGTAERRNVVCGATNVEAGRKYPFAPVGATLPGGLHIEKRKLRGELSEGMLCSARELGLGQDGDGIWELGTDAPPGSRLLEALAIADHRLVVDVGPNRPDLLGHKGIARELSASYGVPFRLPVIPGSPAIDVPPVRRVGNSGSVGAVRTATEDLDGCPRLLAAVLRGVRVGPSPEWLARRLEAAGVRSINNVVDATNYVMLELNQPMHAYDIARLRGPSVVARRAAPGETVVTLDGVERKLTPEMTVIADDGGAIGVAGVMGGAATEVTAETTDVFLECAYFTPAGIRRTRRALGLSTEASYRFERGIDRWGGVEALRRCIDLIGATAGGELADTPIDVGPGPGESAPHLPAPGPGHPAAGRGAALAVVGELPGGDWCDRGLQAGRRPHCGRGSQLAARSAPRGGPDRGDRSAPRLREIPGRASTLPSRDVAGRRDRTDHEPSCAVDWSSRVSSRYPRCRLRRPMVPTASGCSIRCPVPMAIFAGGFCRGWCGWWSATGPIMWSTCDCSRSAPSSPRPRPENGPGKSVTWRQF